MTRKGDKEIPEFKTPEQERDYWEERSALVEGHKGRANEPKARRSSFLVVRLTGEEITSLRDIAARKGVGPSTFARNVLTAIVEREHKGTAEVSLEDVKAAAEDFISSYASLRKTTLSAKPNNELMMVRDQDSRTQKKNT